MEVKVFWTAIARCQLEDIFDYYKDKAGAATARKLVKEIVNRTLQLETNPLSGQLEPLLEDRKNEYRYLVEGNYKIIYCFEGFMITIAAVFDCRQNPKNYKFLIDMGAIEVLPKLLYA